MRGSSGSKLGRKWCGAARLPEQIIELGMNCGREFGEHLSASRALGMTVPAGRYNQRYPTFARFIGATFAYARLQIFEALNLRFFAFFSSLDIRKIVSYSGITVWTRFHEHRALNAAVAAIAPVAVVTCLTQVSLTWPAV